MMHSHRKENAHSRVGGTTLMLVGSMLLSSILFLFTGNTLSAQDATGTRYVTEQPVRFAAVDVFVDSGEQPLAAYQFELFDRSGVVKIVGIEGGEYPAYQEPPYYDPAAMRRSRVILAAFNTGKDLPKGKTRIARIHVQITGEKHPDYAIELDVAATSDGKEIPAVVTISKGEPK